MSDTPPQDQIQPVDETQEPYYRYPGPSGPPQPPRKKSGGIGCWLVGLMTVFVAAMLVVAGLFLPPISLADRLFGPQYTMLDAQSNAAANNGLTVIVDPEAPGTEFGVALSSVAVSAFTAGSSDAGEWVAGARSAVPPYLSLQSPVYVIDSTGSAPEATTLTIELPADVAANRDLLDLYTYDDSSGQWEFVPARVASDGTLRARVDRLPEYAAVFQAAPLDPVLLTTLQAGQTISAEIAGLMTIISPAGMQPALPTTPQRTLVGNPAAGFEIGSRYRVMPVIRNFTDPRATDADTVIAIIGNRELRDEHIQQLTSFASSGGYQGVLIDYRDLPAEQRGNFSAFIRELAHSLHSANLRLGVVVPPAENIAGAWETGAYDWRALGRVTDYLQINFGLDPTTFTPGEDRLVEAMMRWAIGEVSRYKLLGGLSALSTRQVSGEFTSIGYSAALAALGDVRLEADVSEGQTIPPGSEIRISLDGLEALPGVDTTVQTPFIEYLRADGSISSRMWLTTGDALRFRMERLSAFNIGGVAFGDLLASGVTRDIPEAILNYKIQLPGEPVQPELVLNWRIESADGQVTEFTTGFNEEIVVTLEAPDGNYAVNVEVVGGSVSSSRSGAAVALFAPTATPTPLPTETPTPEPTNTPTLAPAPVQPAQQEAPAGPPPAAPGAGSIAVGNFEYGGHVTSTGSDRAADAMRRAGMTWMKVQIPYRLGQGTGGAANAIQQAHARGFKIVLGIVGSPAELAAGGGDYIRQYANFVGEVAALGPEAIEVWNEPNLSREWPEGQISGGNYTALLRESYNAIKSRNGSVMVISGALAPTGAEAAFPGRVVNDDNFLRQMVDAGALQYMDCVGVHYNEGIVSPRQTSGDPRDNYYTRYLQTMMNVYWNITGGQKPLCITELGFLTSEGYPPLPDFFRWAEGVTVAQQAAWLAESAAITSQSGRVRLMIIWNIDFTRYDADPMAGYAIIRPDGSCPACSALAGAR
jgi:spore germination protein YaaH